MILFRNKCILIATIALLVEGNGVRAFVPENTRVRIGGGKTLISTPSESLSFASYFHKTTTESQQRSPRISEANFRLDYVQGVRPPQKIHTVVKDDPKKTDDDFVYGRNSSCYRGLTKPTKAGLVLALILMSGMIVASPDIHLPSLTSLIEGSRHLMGDDVASDLSALVDRIAFQWDMLGIEDYVHGVSNQLALSFNNKLLPFSSLARDNLHEITARVSGKFDVVLAQFASGIDSMKYDFSNTMASPEASMNQVFVNGREAFSQRSNEWQLGSQDMMQQLHYQVTQASSNIQAGVNQAWNEGRQSFEAKFASLSDVRPPKIDKLNLDIIEDSAGFRAKVLEEFSRSKDVFMSKSLEYQQASKMGMDRLQGLTNHYVQDMKWSSFQKYTSLQETIAVRMDDLEKTVQTEGMKYSDIAGSYVTQKSSELQELSQAKMIEVGRNINHEADVIQRRLTEVGTDYGIKARDVGRGFIPFIRDLGRSLQDKALALRAASFDAIHKVNNDAFQGHASMDNLAITDTIQDWKDGALNAWSSAKNSIANEFAIQDTLQHMKDSTESIVKQVSIPNTLQNLKENTKSITNELAIQDALQHMKESTGSIVQQVSLQETIQDLKDSTESIANQVSIQENLQDFKESTSNAWSNAGNTISKQVGTIGVHSPAPVATESSFLKSVLNDVAY